MGAGHRRVLGAGGWPATRPGAVHGPGRAAAGHPARVRPTRPAPPGRGGGAVGSGDLRAVHPPPRRGAGDDPQPGRDAGAEPVPGRGRAGVGGDPVPRGGARVGGPPVAAAPRGGAGTGPPRRRTRPARDGGAGGASPPGRRRRRRHPVRAGVPQGRRAGGALDQPAPLGERRPDLRRAHLGRADLGRADLGRADLHRADFRRARLGDAHQRWTAQRRRRRAGGAGLLAPAGPVRAGGPARRRHPDARRPGVQARPQGGRRGALRPAPARERRRRGRGVLGRAAG
ncbi:pentapeptide repeat-containing protein [Micromonospora costi]|uniref:pentapeptide repeat-containing protein n=1 Tax=Micromonospora costi TaxID=1530042 RepID=UPI0035EEB48E